MEDLSVDRREITEHLSQAVKFYVQLIRNWAGNDQTSRSPS